MNHELREAQAEKFLCEKQTQKLSEKGWIIASTLPSAIAELGARELLIDIGGDGIRGNNLINNFDMGVISVSLSPLDAFQVVEPIPICLRPKQHRFVWCDAINSLSDLNAGLLKANVEITCLAENAKNIPGIRELRRLHPELIDISGLNPGSPLIKDYLAAKAALRVLTRGQKVEILEPGGAITKLLEIFKTTLSGASIRIEKVTISEEAVKSRSNYHGSILDPLGKGELSILRLIKLQ